uniref:Uncharacterized protein n=1 Tax=Oryza glumipatula TaxID=40148 RepID=A0A0E0A7D4_9ORYZ
MGKKRHRLEEGRKHSVEGRESGAPGGEEGRRWRTEKKTAHPPLDCARERPRQAWAARAREEQR